MYPVSGVAGGAAWLSLPQFFAKSHQKGEALSATETTADIVRAMAAAMEENRRNLTKLDSEIGDGDHGNNMNRGLQAALERLDGDPNRPLRRTSSRRSLWRS